MLLLEHRHTRTFKDTVNRIVLGAQSFQEEIIQNMTTFVFYLRFYLLKYNERKGGVFSLSFERKGMVLSFVDIVCNVTLYNRPRIFLSSHFDEHDKH